MSATIELLRIVDEDDICAVDHKSAESKFYDYVSFMRRQDAAKLPNIVPDCILSEDGKRAVLTNNFDADIEHRLYNEFGCGIDDITDTVDVFLVSPWSYGKSHAYREDAAKAKAFFGVHPLMEYMREVYFDYMYGFVSVEKRLDGWFFTKRFYHGTRSTYLAFDKEHAVKLLRKRIDMKAIAKRYDVKLFLDQMNDILDSFEDGKTVLRLAW